MTSDVSETCEYVESMGIDPYAPNSVCWYMLYSTPTSHDAEQAFSAFCEVLTRHISLSRRDDEDSTLICDNDIFDLHTEK